MTDHVDIAALAAGLVNAAWKWGHGCGVDDVPTMQATGDSYNEGCRADTRAAELAVLQTITSLEQRLEAMTASRDRTRIALEKLRSERDHLKGER